MSMQHENEASAGGPRSAGTACDAYGRLACPVDVMPLTQAGDRLECSAGHRYPIVQGVPVLLRDDVTQTIGIAEKSLELARRWVDGWRDDPFFMETLGLSDTGREQIRSTLASGDCQVDPIVSHLIGATNGLLYKSLIGKLTRIPIPDPRLPPGDGQNSPRHRLQLGTLVACRRRPWLHAHRHRPQPGRGSHRETPGEGSEPAF